MDCMEQNPSLPIKKTEVVKIPNVNKTQKWLVMKVFVIKGKFTQYII